MMNRKQCVAMLLAGGQGSRLMPLTKKIAKPAVPYGSRYRIIDFPLSNCINSGIDTVGVLTQYQPLELNDYLDAGVSWDMNLRYGGLHVLPPYEGEAGADWFKGTANAIYQNLRFIKRYHPSYVLILSGDHIYKMDYSIMMKEHIENNADCTIAVIDVPLKEAPRFGIMNTDDKGRILEFEEKPEHPKSTQASMGVYMFSTDKLIKYLTEDEADPDSSNDFGKDIIPKMLADDQRMFAYLYKGYWRDVGTLDSFWAANMDAIGMDASEEERLVLNDPGWRIYYEHSFNHPQYIGYDACIRESIVGDGCDIEGTLNHSVVFSDVLVEKDAVIRDSVVMRGAKIGKGARIEYAIVDQDAVIGEGATVGADAAQGKLTVVARDVEVPAGAIVEAGAVADENVRQEEL